ncbi:ATP-binding cassette domain-containing protein [Oscillatoria amoena NRMC-F 0135]|nr:ATP-binding cassette domain-containing protein [Oscillatoria amoena NRMC-F 0135]
MIAFENLTKKFGRICALDNVSCTLQKGQVVSLLGPNGSGKTTLIKIILGLILADKGKLYFENKEVHKHHLLRASWDICRSLENFPKTLKCAK